MKIDPPANANYAATVVRLPALLELEGLDNLRAANLYGFQALISKDHQAGELGVVFPPECQLSESFCAENGLYRHSEKNKDPEAKGYLEDNRRVRAIRLRGHRSDCLWMPLECLSYLKVDLSRLKEGDTFDTLDGKEVCRKYVIRQPRANSGPKAKPKLNRVDERQFPEHVDTQNYFRNAHLIGSDEWVYVTAKLHGTSFRAGRPLVARQLRFRDRIAKRFGVKVLEHEHDAIFGSRKVIKDANNPDQQHFYGSDIWTDAGKRIEHLIPEGYLVFGELVGWTLDGSPIQTNYTYSVPENTYAIYVYRVAVVNPQGILTDLSWPQVKRWCAERGLQPVPDLWEGYHRDFKAEEWLDRRFADEGLPTPPLGSNKKLVDEGVCIRSDSGATPTILKAKSPIFLGHETSLLDKGVADIESQESEDAA